MVLEMWLRALFAFLLVTCTLQPASPNLAATPPMGWNSWDSYGLTVTEGEVRDQARWLAQNLKQYGWQYVVIDEGWYLKNPAAKPGSFQFSLSADGRYLPALNRFPSGAANAGFKPLADYVHGMGLKFGLHIIRGIPREAVERDLPVAGSSFRARDAADRSDTCPWNADNYGVRYSPAGQAYYDSLAKQYAAWNLDFLKVDCIASHPYKAEEIGMISEALRKSGRPIVLSLSPGPAPLERAAELQKQAQMWRISDDVWDHWTIDPAMKFSQGVLQQFSTAADWAGYAGAGHWPDADMLPIGFLGPRPGAGKARASKLSHDEQRTLLTLWCMLRSPLFIGGNLTQADPWTTSLLNNPEVIAVNQRSAHGRALVTDSKKAIWAASDSYGRGVYVALFNLANISQTIVHPLQTLGVGTAPSIRDVWKRQDLPHADVLKVNLAPHASILYRLQ